MKRREFVSRVPALAAGVAVGGAVGVAEASSDVGGHEGVPAEGTAQGGSGGARGFRLVQEHLWTEEWVEGEVGRGFPMHTYVVECPYPVGSKAWFATGDHDEGGSVFVWEAEDLTMVPVVPLKTRRVMFPRFVAGEGEDFRERARTVYDAVAVQGFDLARGPEHEWRVVHVEYRCPDGVEHVMVGLPMSWDPRLALGVMVRGQIG
jgi:hypothetical protein